ncbi:MAG: hypothetical protein HDR05_10105 [Lachnospiraceae bacterium]|nr:hypothetical protein [Lachnospiraceae bacterium]
MVLAEDLRQAVLQAALQGKLTEQLETDSNVDEMLSHIAIHREEIKECKNTLILDAMDIEIPDSWRMVELNSILSFVDYRGKTPNKVEKGIFLITASNIKKGYMEYTRKEYISEEEYRMRQSRGTTNRGDLLFTTEAPLGNAALCDLDISSCGQRIITMQSYCENTVCLELFMYFILSAAFQNELLDNCTGTTAKGIKADKLKHLLIPFPPIEEQQRIVDKINEIMPKIDEYEKIEKELEELKKEFPRNMKDAFLQAAMQGKLTEQLENDSSVEELLEAIKKEKEELIAQKKIKKEKPLPDIEEEEIPFDIPENWRWVRMGNIIKLTSGQDLQPDKYSDNNIGIPYLTGASNFLAGDLIINRYTSCGTSIAYNGELLLTCKGTIGEMAFMNIEKAHIARQIMSISAINEINLKYIKLCLENFILKLKANARSIIPGIDRKVILRLPIPLPPIEEQQRIVERLDVLLRLCEDLKE